MAYELACAEYQQWLRDSPAGRFERQRQLAAETRAHEVRVDALYAGAKTAIVESGASWTPEHHLYSRHIAELCAELDTTPKWLAIGERSGTLVGDNAWSRTRERIILCWPLISAERYATSLHELGHQSDIARACHLTSELVAWRFALERSLVWTRACDARMREALGSYLAAAGENAIAGILAVEAFLKDTDFRHCEKPLSLALREAEQQAFERMWGRVPCEGRFCQTKAVAARNVGTRRLCLTCADDHDTDVRIAELKHARTAATPVSQRDPDHPFRLTRSERMARKVVDAGTICQACRLARAHHVLSDMDGVTTELLCDLCRTERQLKQCQAQRRLDDAKGAAR